MQKLVTNTIISEKSQETVTKQTSRSSTSQSQQSTSRSQQSTSQRPTSQSQQSTSQKPKTQQSHNEHNVQKTPASPAVPIVKPTVQEEPSAPPMESFTPPEPAPRTIESLVPPEPAARTIESLVPPASAPPLLTPELADEKPFFSADEALPEQPLYVASAPPEYKDISQDNTHCPYPNKSDSLYPQLPNGYI